MRERDRSREGDDREITSAQNPRIKALARLRERRERDARGVFPLEEPLAVRRALAAGWPLLEVFHCPEQLDDAGREVLGELRAALPAEAFRRLPARVMARIGYRRRPQGLLVVARQVRPRLEQLRLGERPLVLVCEGVEKPGNLGALVRCADGAGCEALLVAAPGTDPFNPNAVRASRGTLFGLPVVQAGAPELAAWLRAGGLRLVAAVPGAERSYTDADLGGATAVLVGAEDRGLSEVLLAVAHERVAIPMLGRGDSLNVSVSAALLLYEALRQRRGGGSGRD